MVARLGFASISMAYKVKGIAMRCTDSDVATFGQLQHLDDPTPKANRKWIYGAWIANTRLLREFMREGLVRSLDFFGPAGRIYSTDCFGCKCREVPFTDFPLEAHARRYAIMYCSFGWNSGLPSLRARFLPRASIVQTVHSMHYERTLWDFGCHLLWELFEPFDAIVCSSATSRRTIENMIAHWDDRIGALRKSSKGFPGVITEIPLGTDLPARPPERPYARVQLGWSPETCTILVLGRFSSFDKMDHAVLLPLLQRLIARTQRPISLVLAGEETHGEAERLVRIAAQAGLERHLQVYANIDFETRGLLYAASDIFLSPVDHVQETFGLTILEAMAYGRPVVASDWGGYRDLVEHGRTGFLIPTIWGGRLEDFSTMASFDAMTAAYATARRTAVNLDKAAEFLLQLISDDALVNTMGQAGYERVRTRYTWPIVMQQYRELWFELAERRRHAPPTARDLPVPRGHNYPVLFGHYPTHRLSPNDRVSSVASLNGGLQANPVFRLSFSDEQAAVTALISHLQGKHQTVEECLDSVSEKLGVPREKVEDHLLLAAKYGLVEIVPSQQ